MGQELSVAVLMDICKSIWVVWALLASKMKTIYLLRHRIHNDLASGEKCYDGPCQKLFNFQIQKTPYDNKRWSIFVWMVFMISRNACWVECVLRKPWREGESSLFCSIKDSILLHINLSKILLKFESKKWVWSRLYQFYRQPWK